MENINTNIHFLLLIFFVLLHLQALVNVHEQVLYSYKNSRQKHYFETLSTSMSRIDHFSKISLVICW